MTSAQGPLPQGVPVLQQTPRYNAVFVVLKSVIVIACVALASTLGTLVLAECGKSEGAAAPESASLLVDIFSGLPNPVFSLTGAESTRIASALRNLSKASNPVDVTDKLGFRGFEVSSLQFNDTRVTLTVVFDHVVISGETGISRFTDAGLSVHALLLQLTRERDSNIATAIEESK